MSETHDDKGRAQFEEWADSLELDLTRVAAGNEEVYSDCNTDYAWMAWQAALATVSTAPSEAEIRKPLSDEQIRAIYRRTFPVGPYLITDDVFRFAHAIESALQTAAPQDKESGNA